jgi:hypothetical protein
MRVCFTPFWVAYLALTPELGVGQLLRAERSEVDSYSIVVARVEQFYEALGDYSLGLYWEGWNW